MTKSLTDYRKENYLISSYCIALKNGWCMNTSCSTCGAMDLRNRLFQHALGNEISDDAIKELRRTTRFYPRTADLPMEIKNKVLLSHILEFNKYLPKIFLTHIFVKKDTSVTPQNISASHLQ